MNCAVGRRHGLDLALLWLWRRLVATAPIRPLAWEPPHAEGMTLEKAKRQKKKKKKSLGLLPGLCSFGVKAGFLSLTAEFTSLLCLEHPASLTNVWEKSIDLKGHQSFSLSKVPTSQWVLVISPF